MNKLLVSILLSGSVLQGCALPPKLITPPVTEELAFWCSDRYFEDRIDEIDEIHFSVSKESYIYALASSLVLQKIDDRAKIQWFSAPPRLQEIEGAWEKKDTGFEATVFRLMDKHDPHKLQEIIVAFAGSNDKQDWWANLTPRGWKHYGQARDYLIRMHIKYAIPASVPLIVTGHSLGGGLALNSIKDEKTAHRVARAYVFNSSTKTYSWNISRDPKVWAASTSNEAMRLPRIVMRSLGARIAPEEQRAEGFNLISTNPIRSHFNYILTRSLLYVADLAYLSEDGISNNEPRQILETACKCMCSSRYSGDIILN